MEENWSLQGGGACIMQPSNVSIQQVKKLYGPTSLCLEPLNVSIQQEKKLYGPTYLHLAEGPNQ